MPLPKSLTTVTTFSKTLAMIFFILLPFIGFFLGTMYQQRFNELITSDYKQKIRPAKDTDKDINTSPLKDYGTFSYGDQNEAKHSYTIYYTYFDQTHDKMNKVKFMENVSMENSPGNIQTNGKRFFFRFSGPGDGHVDYVANVRPPFNIKQYNLPNNFATDLYSIPLTWVDNQRILYKQTSQKQNYIESTYWIMNVDTSEKERVKL